jgi:hypothetical protein
MPLCIYIGVIISRLTMNNGFTCLTTYAYPNIAKDEFEKMNQKLEQCETPNEKINLIIEHGFHSAALIGTVSNDESRDARIAQFIKANNAVLNNEANKNTPGRQLGIGFQPQVNYRDIARALIANSNTLTPKDLEEAQATVTKKITHGANMYVAYLTNSQAQPIQKNGHIDLYFEPVNGGTTWWMSSFVNPSTSANKEVIDRLCAVGFTHFTPTPPKKDVETLFADMPPNQTGKWNMVLTGELNEKGKATSFAQLMIAKYGRSDKFTYQTQSVVKRKLNVEEYRNVCVIRELETISKTKKAKFPLSLGTHFGINSCVHLANGIFKGDVIRKPVSLIDYYKKQISSSDTCWIATGVKQHASDLLSSDVHDFSIVEKQELLREFNETYYQKLYKDPMHFSSSRQGTSISWQNYDQLTEPVKDEVTKQFFRSAAETGLTLVKKRARPLRKVETLHLTHKNTLHQLMVPKI